MKYLTTAETASLVRAALKDSFPGVKFSVRSHVYSGGSSIRVSYDGVAGYKPIDACYCRDGGPTLDPRDPPNNRCAKCGYVGRAEYVYKPGMPSYEAVDAVVGRYHGAGFDGMVDLEYPITAYVKDGRVVGSKSPGSYGSVPAWDDAPEGAEAVHFGAKYLYVEARA
jgi:hypothetical protein